ncbi:unnamed protein product [Thelazia callipaeda]|uniref:PDZ domain-containing protein n=1 Tax=Thelazia callipaeda TaxID=103827 RepID=A0A0N5D1N3_THECL|nr:unnamed protein product [Thelazia callipaeda]
MVETLIVMRRASFDVPFGFTMRHISFHPSNNEPATKYDSKSWCTLAVLRVEPNGVAAKAGLQVGQRIIELNGLCVTHFTYQEICKITQR